MFFQSWWQSRAKVLMLGLDAAGKTTIEYRLSSLDTPGYPGTIGFSVENWKYKNLDIASWDVGGQDKIRIIWKHYFQGVTGLVFVVDSSDRERMAFAREELNLLLQETDLGDAALLVLANKQDLPTIMTVDEIAEFLELERLSPRPYHIQGTCATRSLDGLHEGFEWLRKACGEARSWSRASQQLHHGRYFPGDYIVRTRLQVLPELPSQRTSLTFPACIDEGISIRIEKIEIQQNRHYGVIKKPVSGWVLIEGLGCGEYLRQHEFVVTLSFNPIGNASSELQCHNLAGDQLANFQLDDSLETVSQFRASLASRIGKSSTSLRIIMPNGTLLPYSGSKQSLLEALMLNEPDVASLKPSPVACIVQ